MKTFFKTITLTALCIFALATSISAQETQNQEITQGLLLDLGGSVWGAGAGFEFQSRHFALFGGAGSSYVTSDIFYSGGLKYYISVFPKSSFFLGLGYGKTAHVEETLISFTGELEEKSQDLFGPSFLAGYRWLFTQEKRVGLSIGAGALYTPDLPDWAVDSNQWEVVPVITLDIRLF